jgi:hypothetical protein
MKVMYGLCESTKEINIFSEYFSSESTMIHSNIFDCQIKVGNYFIKRSYTKSSMTFEKSPIFIKSPVKSIFIPVMEMLSHSQGFLEMHTKYKMPFDQTQIDILVNSGLPTTREISSLCKILLEKIDKIIDGEVLYEDGKYYIVKKSGLLVEFSLEASGFQKFGLLWKLLRNGLLEKESVLFWDEPEASTNPELMSALTDILLELSRNGVQIFIATHSEILASYLDVSRNDGDDVMFYSLYKKGEQIKYDKNKRFEYLRPNKLSEEVVKLYKEQLKRGTKNADR